MPRFIGRRSRRESEMDRKELRFRILFEYYNHFHSGFEYDADEKIKKIDADGNEKRAAKIWLIDEHLVNGQATTYVGGMVHPSIGRINSTGINFVESVMDSAFTEIRGRDEGFDSLTRSDKIKRFAAECLNSSVTGSLCRATYDAIASLMK